MKNKEAVADYCFSVYFPALEPRGKQRVVTAGCHVTLLSGFVQGALCLS